LPIDLLGARRRELRDIVGTLFRRCQLCVALVDPGSGLPQEVIGPVGRLAHVVELGEAEEAQDQQ
jgi:hypothetical protein